MKTRVDTGPEPMGVGIVEKKLLELPMVSEPCARVLREEAGL